MQDLNDEPLSEETTSTARVAGNVRKRTRTSSPLPKPAIHTPGDDVKHNTPEPPNRHAVAEEEETAQLMSYEEAVAQVRAGKLRMPVLTDQGFLVDLTF